MIRPPPISPLPSWTTGKDAAPAPHSSRRCWRGARAGRVSSGLPEQGVLDVTVDLPAATRARSTVEKAADLWARGVRKLIDQTYMFPPLPQAGLIPAVER